MQGGLGILGLPRICFICLACWAGNQEVLRCVVIHQDTCPFFNRKNQLRFKQLNLSKVAKKVGF